MALDLATRRTSAGNGGSTRRAPTHAPTSSAPLWRSRTRACTSRTAGCTVIAATTTAGCSAPLRRPRPDRLLGIPRARPAARAGSGPRRARPSTAPATCTSPPAMAARRRALTSATPSSASRRRCARAGSSRRPTRAALSGADLDLGSTGPVAAARLARVHHRQDGGRVSAEHAAAGRHRSSPRLPQPSAARRSAATPMRTGRSTSPARTASSPCVSPAINSSPCGARAPRRYPPILAGPGLWAVGGGALYQLDPRSGRVRFSASIGDPAHFATPAASGGRVFVAAGGRVYAFG